MGDHAGEDEGRQEGEGENKRIKEAVVPSPHTVAHPRAVMVKPFHTVVADTAVRGPGRPKHLTGEAILEFHCLPVDHHLPSPRGRSVCGAACVIDLLLQGSGLTDGGPGQDARVRETGLQETAHDEEEEDGSDDRNGQGQCAGQVGTVEDEEEDGGAEDEQQREREDAAVAAKPTTLKILLCSSNVLP